MVLTQAEYDQMMEKKRQKSAQGAHHHRPECECDICYPPTVVDSPIPSVTPLTSEKLIEESKASTPTTTDLLNGVWPENRPASEIKKDIDLALRKVDPDRHLLRCEVTHNPCGTDTWGNGSVCQCKSCQQYLSENGISKLSDPTNPICKNCGQRKNIHTEGMKHDSAGNEVSALFCFSNGSFLHEFEPLTPKRDPRLSMPMTTQDTLNDQLAPERKLNSRQAQLITGVALAKMNEDLKVENAGLNCQIDALKAENKKLRIDYGKTLERESFLDNIISDHCDDAFQRGRRSMRLWLAVAFCAGAIINSIAIAIRVLCH